MSGIMMKCGHAAQGEDAAGKPVCAICFGLRPEAVLVDDVAPNLNGRLARCGYCGQQRPSETGLAFFAHQPEKPCDSYYCGCRGWN